MDQDALPEDIMVSGPMSESTNSTLASARYTRVKLWPRGPFHFGKRGVGLNGTEIAMPADSFFSAMCSAIHELQGPSAVAKFIARFPTADSQERVPPLRITSLMPFTEYKDDTKENTHADASEMQAAKTIPMYLLPMPMLHIQIRNDPISQRKQMKSIEWISSVIFERIISGKSLVGDEEILENAHDDQKAAPRTVQRGSVWLTKTEYNRLNGRGAQLWTVSIRPRVAVDRVTGASAVYSSGGIRFTDNSGLYLYIEWLEGSDEALRQQVEAAIHYLGDSGIGGERTYGYGHFVPCFEHLGESPIIQPEKAKHVTTLSPFLPKQSERTTLADESTRYEIILRRGWLTLPGYSNLRRPTVRMVNTGAILSTLNGVAPVGYLANATPSPLTEYTVYRYGLCWPVSVIPQDKPG